MPTNIFDLIDGVLQGLIFFIYNLVATLGQLARHPLTAPMRLYARYQRKSVKQVSPWSFMVLALIWFQMSVPGIFSASEGDEARAAVPLWVQGQASSTTILRLFVESAIAGAVLDLMVRGLASATGIKRAQRRAYFVAAVEYSTGFTLWFIALTTSALAPAMGIEAINFSVLPPASVGSIATAFVGFRMIFGRSRINGSRWLRWFGLYGAALLLIGATFFTQIWIQQNLCSAKTPGLEVIRLACTADGATGTATVTIWNNATKPLFVDGLYRKLVFQPWGDEDRPERWSTGAMSYRRSAVEDQGVSPGTTAVLSGRATFDKPVRTQNGYCRIGEPDGLESAAVVPDVPDPTAPPSASPKTP